ncbi:MAG: nitric oxide reductase large subunit, partial [Sphingomonadales bacterium 32-67-7]
MGEYRKLWWTLIAVLVVTFSILGFYGTEFYRKPPPIPDRVISASGTVLMTRDDILDGQTAWQSTGGMQLGSVWGHGAYQAPDWSADWLHRELISWLDLTAQATTGKPFDTLRPEEQAKLRYWLEQEYRKNSYDPDTGTLTVSDRRAQAMAQGALRHS